MKIDLDSIQVGLIIEAVEEQSKEWRKVSSDHDRVSEYDFISHILQAYQGSNANDQIATLV